MKLARRNLLKAGATLIAAASIMAVPSMASAADKVVRVLTFGSTWEKVIKPLAPKFKEQTGYEIVPVIENSSAEGLAKLQASRANPGVDVWFTGEAIAMRAATDKDLFLPLPKDKIPNLANVMPGAVNDKFVAFWYFPTGIVYRPDLVPGGKITAWSDLFKPAMKNKVALPAPTVYPGRTILITALLNGGSEDNVKPGIEFLAKHKDDIAMFHSSDSNARKALASGEISAMIGSPSAVKALKDDGIPAAMTSPKPTPLIFEGMMMVNNGNPDGAAAFINASMSDEWQKFMTDVYNLAPVNKNVKPAEALVAVLPTPENAVKFDEAKINEKLGAWTEEFNAAVAK
ncbi:ABC transporter substrate-binding protein [Chelatococcus asaccharovorans]|uniref:Putative spermidine/putrescine transport system substrate-binding protein n=1 Tax=Chelatococcus asaccharovorans TaxID=28210 RepID=A0A2V3U5T1_9HYPH|nr:extracellular solute-binding protein [Chelatococcus asaccharovorans]MBS7703686.1 extracellular solute-binding protein [Chelatococcus asaccharovorans]PXW57844.1 putative spermidine/putrescine transport system substrate-binding protein [Chelatococcus asaccharovorans]